MAEKHSSNFLGKGTYGQVVSLNGTAVKKFKQLYHLAQEYSALKYLSDCDYIVHSTGADFSRLQLKMELYDCSLRDWLDVNYKSNILSDKIIRDRDIIIHDVLCGLVELHDRGLSHNDLKPGNILIRLDPMKAVLGDCGFVSIARYSKSQSTAIAYRDPEINRDITHDLFSLGICLFELVTRFRIKTKKIGNKIKVKSYEELFSIVERKIEDLKFYEVIKSLLGKDKSKRLSAREILKILYDQDYPEYHPIKIRSKMNNIDSEYKKYVCSLIQVTAPTFGIDRNKKGCYALLFYLDKHNIPTTSYILYAAVVLMLLGAVFGKYSSRFQETECLNLISEELGYQVKLPEICQILDNLLEDQEFLIAIYTQ